MPSPLLYPVGAEMDSSSETGGRMPGTSCTKFSSFHTKQVQVQVQVQRICAVRLMRKKTSTAASRTLGGFDCTFDRVHAL